MFNTIKKLLSFFKHKVFAFSPFLFDLGSYEIKINIPEKGIITIPSLISYHIHKKDYLFYGKEAKQLIGKLPKEIEIIYPIKKGVVNNFDALFSLLTFIMEEEILKAWKEFKFKIPLTSALTAVPYFSTEIEQRASLEVIKKLGFNKVFTVFSLVALGYGIFENFSELSPTLILDLGAGKTEAGVVGRGGIVFSKHSDISGFYLDEKIKNYLYIKYGIVIGRNTSERLKIKLLNFNQRKDFLVVKGKALDTGLPKQIKVNSFEIQEALIPYFHQIIDLIKSLIEESPPEIIEEITNNGLYIAGGLAKTPGLDNFFSDELKIKTFVVEDENVLLKGLKRISQSQKLLYYSTV